MRQRGRAGRWIRRPPKAVLLPIGPRRIPKEARSLVRTGDRCVDAGKDGATPCREIRSRRLWRQSGGASKPGCQTGPALEPDRGVVARDPGGPEGQGPNDDRGNRVDAEPRSRCQRPSRRRSGSIRIRHRHSDLCVMPPSRAAPADRAALKRGRRGAETAPQPGREPVQVPARS